MDALEQLIEYRDVDPVDDRLVAQVVDTITRAARDDQRHPRHHRSTPRRHRNGRRLAVVSGAVIAALAAGGGLAAATGLFGPPHPLPAALWFMSSPDPSKVPGAVVQLNVPGPEGTTFRVVTDTVTANNQIQSCVALAIEGPSGKPLPVNGDGVCAGLAAPPGSTVPQLLQETPSGGLTIWRAPSGANFLRHIRTMASPGSPRLRSPTIEESPRPPNLPTPADTPSTSRRPASSATAISSSPTSPGRSFTPKT